MCNLDKTDTNHACDKLVDYSDTSDTSEDKKDNTVHNDLAIQTNPKSSPAKGQVTSNCQTSSENNERQRCKYPGCMGKSFIKCRKCEIYLCLNKNRNCF